MSHYRRWFFFNGRPVDADSSRGTSGDREQGRRTLLSCTVFTNSEVNLASRFLAGVCDSTCLNIGLLVISVNMDYERVVVAIYQINDEQNNLNLLR